MHMALLERPDRERGFGKERILRVLLSHDGAEITKYRVAQLAEVTEAWCREYTERLEADGLIEDTEIVDARGLYREWQKERIEPNQLTVSFQNPMDLLEATELAYALTTYQAENLHQGFLFPSTTDFYVLPAEIDDWLTVVERKGMLGGGNTRIRVHDEHVLRDTECVEGFRTVAMAQLIVDLLDEGGPCEAAAEKLIASVHGEV